MKRISTIILVLTITIFCKAQNTDSIKRADTVSKHIIELRLGAGIDYIFVPNGQIGFNFILFSNDNTRFSIDNIAGVFVPWLLYYFTNPEISLNPGSLAPRVNSNKTDS
jgi:hypothetical protein